MPGVVAVDPGVRQVEERFPVEEAARPAGTGRVLAEEAPGGGDVADGGRRGDRRPRELGLLLEQRLGFGVANGVVAAVEQTAEPEEIVGRTAGPDLPALLMWVAGVALDHRQMAAERRPTGEAVLMGDDELASASGKRSGAWTTAARGWKARAVSSADLLPARIWR